ncbi:MAG: N-acetylmuramoyl-L-alanine amidase [Clostridia bacterium]|nr:N-acetylmuramoyl-L-alanine amidase [Clostridia bacterium]
MITARQMFCPQDKKAVKFPHQMTPTRIVVHNTANDASANNEITYMNRNNNQVSFHFAVDDKEVVQGLPLDVNGWHAGDGAHGKGNREGIAVEICYSKSGGARFDAAERLAAQFIAQLLKQYGWGIDRVTKHQDYSGKYCPHRTLDRGWDRFLDMIRAELKEPGEDVVQAVIAGRYGNGEDRKKRLAAAGYDYNEVQRQVNERLGITSAKNVKSIDELAREVIRGEWGNGADRKNRLTAAGYDYNSVQRRVNELL